MNRTAFVAIALVALVLGISLPLASNTLLKGLPGSTQTTQIIHSYLTGASAAQQINVGLITPGLRSFSSYDDLAQYLKDMSNLKALVDRLMHPAITYLYRDLAIPAPLLATGVIETVAKEGVSTTTTSFSKTNVQVEGVDEPDMVKTNGRLITVASGNKVFVVDVAEKRVLSTLIMRNDHVKGLFLHDDELIIITESLSSPYPLRAEVECRCLVVPPGTTNTTVYIYNLTEASNPVLLGEVSVTGSMLNSRITGSNLYLVINMYFNEPAVPLINNNPIPLESLIAVDQNPNSYTIILALDVESLNYTVYTFITGGGSWLYMSHENLYVAYEKGLNILEVYISVLRAFVKHLPNGIASNVSKALESGYVEEALGIVEKYLAELDEKARDKMLAEIAEDVNKEVRSEATVFYVFSVNGLEVKLRGSFKVAGMLLDQFSMEEMDGFFITATTNNNYSVKVVYEPLVKPFYGGTRETQETRIKVSECDESGVCVTRELILLTSGGTPGIPYEYTVPRLMITTYVAGETSNNVFTVDLGSLQIAGSLRGLASGERIYSARLIDDVFFLVTFRQVDPLFAIDMSDPENPRVLGYLKIPGFSEYLHPLPNGRLLGIGLEDSNLKISLFDVTDPTSMKEISTVRLSPAWSMALYDHHAVTVNLNKYLVLIPISSYAWTYASDGILALTYRGDVLKVESLLQHDNAVRSLYVGGELFTVSTNRIKIYDINTLKELGEIQLEK